ncbi:group II truncated hemoglobin [Halioxenophilus sp. WMMB6]|uniref:group II truncated hemoglobin n=1 Tax=Halioxenophilus sp. WMMB6 TaxID=3073815 RepID=UPI00295EDE62|nr:group II truncated hemoglobin [Halioxenophilus sp. WMMB6]
MSDNSSELPVFGVGDGSYRAVGELVGLEALVERFYQIMETEPRFLRIRNMHAQDLTVSKAKLVAFLSGWLGGPKLFAEQYGSISLPVAHKHLPINMGDKEAWLDCMQQALTELGYPDELITHLLQKFATPAESIRLMCEPVKPVSGAGFHDPV